MKLQGIALHLIFGVALIGPHSVEAQNSGGASKAAASSGESLQSQVERLEMSAGKSTDSSLEVLRELSKNMGSGSSALKVASGRIESAIGRLKTDSAFQQEAARCSEQLANKKKEVQGLQGDIRQEVQELVQRIEALEKRLENANANVSTSVRVMEATKEKIESWQRFYSQVEGIDGKEETIQNIRTKVDVYIRDLASKAR